MTAASLARPLPLRRWVWKHLRHVPEARLRRKQRATPCPAALSLRGSHRETRSLKWPRPVKVGTGARTAGAAGSRLSGLCSGGWLHTLTAFPREPKELWGREGVTGLPGPSRSQGPAKVRRQAGAEVPQGVISYWVQTSGAVPKILSPETFHHCYRRLWH